MEVCLWNAATSQPMIVLDRHRREGILAGQFSPDNTVLAVMCVDRGGWKILAWRANAADTGKHAPSERADGSR